MAHPFCQNTPEFKSKIVAKVYVDPTKWNPAKSRVKGNTEEARRLNQNIETFEHRAREIYNKWILGGKIITADAIKNELVLPAAGQHCLIMEMKKFISNMKARIGNGYSAGTHRNWKVTLGHLEEYLKQSRGVSDIPFRELDLLFFPILMLLIFRRYS